MKYNYIIGLLSIFFSSCTQADKIKTDDRISDTLISVADTSEVVPFIKLSKLRLTGDFNGDGVLDTLLQNNIHEVSKQPIDSIPEMPFDSMQRFFDRAYADLILTGTHTSFDTLHLGSGRGLFCLINVGDINHDKKDEVALVIDNCTFSNICHCQIFTLCNRKWKQVKMFTIHRQAFQYADSDQTNRTGIKGFLEYRSGKWMYIDYLDWFNAETDKDTVLAPMRIKRTCF